MAWQQERQKIGNGKGTNDWRQISQDEIIAINRASDYIGQLVFDPCKVESVRVQFMSFGMEYCFAHKDLDWEYGFYNSKTKCVERNATEHEVDLTDPHYKGIFETQRSLLVGQVNQYGIKVRQSSKKNNNINIETKYGIKMQVAKQEDNDNSDSRKNKYGF